MARDTSPIVKQSRREGVSPGLLHCVGPVLHLESDFSESAHSGRNMPISPTFFSALLDRKSTV